MTGHKNNERAFSGRLSPSNENHIVPLGDGNLPGCSRRDFKSEPAEILVWFAGMRLANVCSDFDKQPRTELIASKFRG